MIAPRWFQLRWGPVLRREPVKRFYSAEITNRGYVSGVRKWLLLTLARRVRSETVCSPKSERLEPTLGSAVIEFDGLGDYFLSLIPYREAVYSELQRIAHPVAVARSSAISEPFIAAHVRRGDLTRQKIPLSQILQHTPTEWFADAIRAIRRDPRWKDLPVMIFSDGSPEELKDLLSIPNSKQMTTEKAVGDILMMARCSLLLASGYSTFSMWASFLGQMPTLYYPGRHQQRLFPVDTEVFEGEWHSGGDLPHPRRMRR
jgi:hypothetical protein